MAKLLVPLALALSLADASDGWRVIPVTDTELDILTTALGGNYAPTVTRPLCFSSIVSAQELDVGANRQYSFRAWACETSGGPGRCPFGGNRGTVCLYFNIAVLFEPATKKATVTEIGGGSIDEKATSPAIPSSTQPPSVSPTPTAAPITPAPATTIPVTTAPGPTTSAPTATPSPTTISPATTPPTATTATPAPIVGGEASTSGSGSAFSGIEVVAPTPSTTATRPTPTPVPTKSASAPLLSTGIMALAAGLVAALSTV